LLAFLAALLLAGVQAGAQDLTNGLASRWVSDDYTNGASWIDQVKGTAAAVDGSPTPLAVANVFGSHAGVMRNTGATGNGGFLIPAANPPTGLTNYTIAVVFQAASAGPTDGSYFNDQSIFGYDIGGGGQPDWGVSWGGSGGRAEQAVVAGIGRLNGDSGIQSGGPLALNTTHAAVFQINGSTGTETLFVDGVQAGQNTGLTILAATNKNGNGSIPLLSTKNSTIGAAFIGSLAEVRVYTNATVSGTALSSYLTNLYAGLQPIILTANPVLVPPGFTVNVQVTIPASASQTGPFTVTLTSDNTGVVASTNVALATGVTSANLLLLVKAAGTARLSASGTGVASSAPLTLTGAILPIILSASTTVASPVGTVSVQVTIPAYASQTGPFTVILTSDNPGVVSSTNVVLATLVTSTNLLLLVKAVGTAQITASGADVTASAPLAITGYPAELPVAWFKANAISGVTNGGAVASWPDYSGNGYSATQGAPSQQPTYVTNAMNGLPVLRFNTTNSTCLAFARPVQDDFTIICVFQSTQGLNSGSFYYQGAGLVNGEVGGVVNDFGSCLFANGSICVGTGNPDVAVTSGGG
jgi:hypothetical protein